MLYHNVATVDFLPFAVATPGRCIDGESNMIAKLSRARFHCVPSSRVWRLLGACLALVVLFSPFTAAAQERQDALISPEQMADTLENALAGIKTKPGLGQVQKDRQENRPGNIQGPGNRPPSFWAASNLRV